MCISYICTTKEVALYAPFWILLLSGVHDPRKKGLGFWWWLKVEEEVAPECRQRQRAAESKEGVKVLPRSAFVV